MSYWHMSKKFITYGNKSQVVGIVKTQINLTSLNDSLRDIKLGQNGYVYVVDNEGRLITHPTQAFVLERPNLSSRKVIADALTNKEPVNGEENYINQTMKPLPPIFFGNDQYHRHPTYNSETGKETLDMQYD